MWWGMQLKILADLIVWWCELVLSVLFSSSSACPVVMANVNISQMCYQQLCLQRFLSWSLFWCSSWCVFYTRKGRHQLQVCQTSKLTKPELRKLIDYFLVVLPLLDICIASPCWSWSSRLICKMVEHSLHELLNIYDHWLQLLQWTSMIHFCHSPSEYHVFQQPFASQLYSHLLSCSQPSKSV